MQADWISKCLTEAKLVDTSDYKVRSSDDSEALLLTIKNKNDVQSSAVVEQHTTESPQTTPHTTPTKQQQHLVSPVKGSPVKKFLDPDDSDYVDSDEGSCDMTTDEHDITTDPPPAKKSKVYIL